MFRGTKAYPPDAYQAIVTRIGARQNAYTTDDFTNYHTDVRQGGPREGPRDRGGPLQEPRLLRRRRSRPRRARSSASTTRTRRTRSRSSTRSSATAPSRAHTYKHTTMGFLADIEDMPNQYEYSKTVLRALVPARAHDRRRRGRRRRRRRCSRSSRSTWGGWKRGAHRVEIPQEPPPQGPVYAHVPWTTPTLPWVDGRVPRPGVLRTCRRTGRRWTSSSTSTSARPPTSTSGSSSRSRRSTSSSRDSGANVDPGLFTVYARVKKPEDAVYVRDEILRTFARARAEPSDAAAARRREVERTQRASCAASTTPTRSPATLARFARVRPLVRHAEPAATAPTPRSRRRRPPGRRAQVLHRRSGSS